MPGYWCVRDVIVRCGSARAAIVATDTVDASARGQRGVSRCERQGVAISALGAVGTVMPSVNAAIECVDM